MLEPVNSPNAQPPAAGPTARLTLLRGPLLIAAGGLMLAWPAIYNGYPLLWFDSCRYLLAPWHDYVAEMRSPFYGLAIAPLVALATEWAIVAAQCAIVAAMIFLVLRTTLGRMRAWSYLLLLGLLALLTGVSWHSSLIMADVFAGVLPLGIFLLAFVRDRLAWWERALVFAVACLASLVHYSHLLLVAAIAISASIVLLLERRPSRQVAFSAACCLAVVAITIGAHMGLQWRWQNKLQISPNGSLFLLARLVEDGPAKDYLSKECPAANFLLCKFVNDMPMPAARFLWWDNGPVKNLGGPQAISAEAGIIVSGALRQEPLRFVWMSLGHTLRQLVLFRMDEVRDFSTRSKGWWNCAADTKVYLPGEYTGLVQSRQSNAGLGMDTLFFLQVLTVVVTGVLLVVLVCTNPQLRAERRFRELAWLILVTLLANAAICGALSEPDARYQSRVIWLLPLFFFMAATFAVNARRARFLSRS